jgi:hypothetical protein
MQADQVPGLSASGLSAPLLDARSAAQFYEQALVLAKAYCPEWTQYWPPEPDPGSDPGLVVLKLFSILAKYTADMENQLPEQRRLAFFKFMNIQLRPPVAARTALHFSLKAGRAPRLITRHSAVLQSGEQAVRFETEQDLLVVPAPLCAALTIMPAQDTFIDAMPVLTSGRALSLFPGLQQQGSAARPLGHWFMFGDAQLFKPDPALQDITINLTGKQLHEEYFSQWCDAALTPLAAQLTPDPSGRHLSLQIRLSNLPGAAAATISQLQERLTRRDGGQSGAEAAAPAQPDQQADYWLVVKPAPYVKVQAALSQQLPVITGLECVFNGAFLQAQRAAFNQVLLDIANGAFPFGESPRKDDAFYIRCDSVFSRKGALVTLHFSLSEVKHDAAVTLLWQLWDGKQWVSFNATPGDAGLYRFVDTTDQLRHNNPQGATMIQFQCPAIVAHTVAGGSGLWIRALIADGGYGEDGAVVANAINATIDAIPPAILTDDKKTQVIAYLNDVAGVNFSYQLNPSQYSPPFIKSLQITFSYAATPQRLWTYNNFALSRFLFSPFKAVDERDAGFYFAFSKEQFVQHTLGHPLSIYFELDQDTAAPAATLAWQYFDGLNWQPLKGDDASQGLSRSGIVTLAIPAAMPAAALFSQTAFWFRINNPQVGRNVRVVGMYPNAVMARNVTSIEAEVLGSSNATPNQVFTLSSVPVLPEVELGVMEAAGLELDMPGTPSSATQPVLRLWQQVDHFAYSGPTDRVYTLDCQNGRITFGDGRNGMVPPRGHDNIVASYEQSQGLRGNAGAGTLAVLRSGVGDIDSVTNPGAARGGVGGDTRADLARSSPALIKAGRYAVDLDDISALAAASHPEVAQARAIETARQEILIVLIARSADPVPDTSAALLKQVGDCVKEKCLAPLARRLSTSAPDFVPVSVSVQLAANVPADQIHALQTSIGFQLAQFFHPVSGGPNQAGWRFGETVRAAAVSLFLARLPQVEAVRALSLNGRWQGDIDLAPNQLPVAGPMSIYLSAG